MVVFAAAICLLAPMLASADVADSSPNGFTVRITLNIQAAPEDVYRKLVHNVGDWWDASHSYSGNAHNFSIDDKPLGCFCEKLPNGGGVRHFEVLRAIPAKTLVLGGGMGPLQAMAVTGTMVIEFASSNGGTKMDVTYAVAGYRPEGMMDLAPVVDSVLTGLMVRLKNYAEHGKP